MRLHASAPTRIDLAGGTLDIWPLYLFHPGALTLNLALSRLARCLLEPRADRRIVLINRDTGRREAVASLRALQKQRRYRLPLPAHMVRFFAPSRGLTLTTWSEVPAGSGLGGSSALAVALGAAFSRWLGRRLSRQELVFLGRDTDARVLGVPTGEQDHYPAAFGGVNAIRLEPLGTRREPLVVDLRALEARLLLAYTGEPRRSGINNWDVVKRYLDGDRRLRRNFSQIAATAAAMRQALVKENWKELARLLRHEWRTRRRNAPAISTPFIDRLIRAGRRAGAGAAKVCGAGGGGCVVFLGPPHRYGAVATALAAAGATLLPFRIARRGVRVEVTR